MYFEPEFKVVLVEAGDVITTSNGGSNKEEEPDTLPEQELD